MLSEHDQWLEDQKCGRLIRTAKAALRELQENGNVDGTLLSARVDQLVGDLEKLAARLVRRWD